MKLHIGCGKDIKKGWVNLDIAPFPGVDVVHNLQDFPYPFANNQFQEVYAQHILEHLSDLSGGIKEISENNQTRSPDQSNMPLFFRPWGFQ